MVVFFAIPVFAQEEEAINPCGRCVKQCDREYDKAIKRCDNPLINGDAKLACILVTAERYIICIEECFMAWDYACDQYFSGGGGPIGPCHYDIITGTCVPYAN